MTETEKAVVRIQSILCHLKAVNRQKLTEREQAVLTDVIASVSHRVAYFLQQDGSVAFHSLSQRFDPSQRRSFQQKEERLFGNAVRYDATGNGERKKQMRKARASHAHRERR